MEIQCSNQVAQCMTPFFKKETRESFPCGKCPECLKRRVSGWSFRLKKEMQRATSAFFITLTYDTDHVPISPNGFMTLDKKHPPLWIKRLRKFNQDSGNPIKYYLCGEYGTDSKRPHYHVIIFNVPLSLIIGETPSDHAFAYPEIYLDGKYPFKSQSWIHGHITIGQVNEASIGYCLKYMQKPVCKILHDRDDRQIQFSLMSKKLGDNYLTPQMKKWHKGDLLNRMYVPIEDGKKIAMPRYYKEKIYTKTQRQIIGMTMENKDRDEKSKQTSKQERAEYDKKIGLVHKFEKEQRKTTL